jgi:hypothetical protein
VRLIFYFSYVFQMTNVASANCNFEPNSRFEHIVQKWQCQIIEQQGNLRSDDVCIYKIKGPLEFEISYFSDLFYERVSDLGFAIIPWNYKRERTCYKGECSPHSLKQAHFYLDSSRLVYQSQEWGGSELNMNGKAVYSCTIKVF